MNPISIQYPTTVDYPGLFSILRIILLHQNYASLWFHSDKVFNNHDHCDQINGFLLEECQFLPKYITDFNSTETEHIRIFTRKTRRSGMKSNLLFLNQSIAFFENFIFPYLSLEDHTVVVFSGKIKFAINILVEHSKLVGSKTMFISQSNVTYFKPSSHDKMVHRLSTRSSNQSIYNFVANAFGNKTYNLHRTKLVAFLQLILPRTCLGFYHQNYVFAGPDAFAAEALGQFLNASLDTKTDIALEYPNFHEWFNKPAVNYNEFLLYYEKIVTKSSISTFNYSSSDYADLTMASLVLKRRKDTSNKHIEYLYPHDIDCLRVVVPTIKSESQFLIKLLRNHNCEAILVALFIIAAAKIVLGQFNFKEWFQVLFITFGIFLSQRKIPPRKRLWESIWNGVLILFSLVSLSALSGITYTLLVSTKHGKQIDTFRDLLQSNLTIFAPQFLSEDFAAWDKNLDSKLYEKIHFQKSLSTIVDKEYPKDAAYISQEGTAEFQLSVLREKYLKEDMPMRMMKQPIFCGLMSYAIVSKSPFKETANIFIQRIIENGLQKKLKEWTSKFLNDIAFAKSLGQNEESVKDKLILSMSKIIEVFKLYAFGIAISSGVFLVEMLLHCRKYRHV